MPNVTYFVGQDPCPVADALAGLLKLFNVELSTRAKAGPQPVYDLQFDRNSYTTTPPAANQLARSRRPLCVFKSEARG